MAYGPPICAACGATDGIECHHLYLKADGCPDDLTVWLCHKCHGRAHQLRRRIHGSEATKAALAAAKARGVALGGWRGGPMPSAQDRAKATQAKASRANARAQDLAPMIAQLRRDGVASLCGIADALNVKGVPSVAGGRWTATAVKRAVARMDAANP